MRFWLDDVVPVGTCKFERKHDSRKPLRRIAKSGSLCQGLWLRSVPRSWRRCCRCRWCARPVYETDERECSRKEWSREGTNDGDDDVGQHSVRYVSGKLFSFEYTAPPGPNLLSYKKNSVACMVPNSGGGIGVIFSASRMRAGVGGSCFFGRGDPGPSGPASGGGEFAIVGFDAECGATFVDGVSEWREVGSPSIPARRRAGLEHWGRSLSCGRRYRSAELECFRERK